MVGFLYRYQCKDMGGIRDIEIDGYTDLQNQLNNNG